MSESSLHELQSRFAAHIRNPDEVPAPEGIEDRRMGIYRRLFFNNIRNFLGSYFPVLKRIYGPAGWAVLARDFYVEYRAQTPLFPELPREFLRYLLDTREPRSDDPPFLKELAHYEWVRQSLAVDDNDLPADPPSELPLTITLLDKSMKLAVILHSSTILKNVFSFTLKLE